MSPGCVFPFTSEYSNLPSNVECKGEEKGWSWPWQGAEKPQRHKDMKITKE